MLLAVGGGWQAASRAHWWPVRLVRRWIDRVVRPLVASRSWARRTGVIALNNITICAALTAAGSLGRLAWLAVAGVGFSLGIGLRLLLAEPSLVEENAVSLPGGSRLVAGLGLALNLLEPPAILLAGGLALAQKALWPFLSATRAWCVFAWVVPALLILAAAGESLWMGMLRPVPSAAEPTPADSMPGPQGHQSASSPIDHDAPSWHDIP